MKYFGTKSENKPKRSIFLEKSCMYYPEETYSFKVKFFFRKQTMNIMPHCLLFVACFLVPDFLKKTYTALEINETHAGEAPEFYNSITLIKDRETGRRVVNDLFQASPWLVDHLPTSLQTVFLYMHVCVQISLF